MIYYNLHKEISADRIIKDIQTLVTKNSVAENSETVLVISLQKITDYAGDNLLPKIEYKE